MFFFSKIFKDAKQHIRKRFRKKTGDSISLGGSLELLDGISG